MVDIFRDPLEEQELLRQYAARDRRYEQVRAQVTPELQQRMVALTQRRRDVAPGVVSTFAASGVPVEAIDAVPADGGSNWFERSIAATAGGLSGLGNALWSYGPTQAVRGAMTLLDTAYHEAVGRPLTSALAAAGDGFGGQTFGDAYRDYGNSVGVVAFNKLRQEGIGAALEKDNPDTDADESFLGTGFLPGGQVAQESYDQRTLEIDGQRGSLGTAAPYTRVLGRLGTAMEQAPELNVQTPFGRLNTRQIGRFVSPGETGYNLTVGLTNLAAEMFLDPAAKVSSGSKAIGAAADMLGAGDKTVDALRGGFRGIREEARTFSAADANALRQRFESAAGVIDAPARKTVLMQEASTFLRDPDLAEALAGMSKRDIWRKMRTSRAPNVDLETVSRLGDAKTAEEVTPILLDAIGAGRIRQQDFLAGQGNFVRKGLHAVWENTPGVSNLQDGLQLSARGRLHADDLDGTAARLDSWLGQMKVSDEVRDAYFDRVTQVKTNDDLFDVLTDAVAEPLFDLEADELKELTRLVGDQKGELSVAGRLFGTDNAGRPTGPQWARRNELRDGDVEVVPTPELIGELVDDGFVMPDPTIMRRSLQRRTNLQKVYQSKGWTGANDAARWLTRDVFKPMAILRPAYIVRIGLEEQARLAANGLDSIFSNPVAFITANLRNRDELADLVGDNMLAQTQRSHIVTTDATGILDHMGHSRKTGTQVWTGLSKAETSVKKFSPAWLRELRQLSADPAVREIARGADADAVVAWARSNPEGQRWVERMSRVNDEAARALSTDDGIRAWVNNTAIPRLHLKSGGVVRKLDDGTYSVADVGDRELLDAIGDQSVFDEQIDWTGRLRNKHDIAPDVVKAEMDTDAIRGKRAAFVDGLFHVITGKPTSYFARFPAYRQLMVRNAGELMEAMSTPALRKEVFEAAQSNLRLTAKEAQELRRAMTRANAKVGGGTIDSVDELNELVKVRTAQQVKDLLFDTTRRSNYQEKYEVLFPFFDAWKEVTTTWARLANENKAFMIRATQGYQSLEEGGTVYVNDSGEKVFAYPGGEALARFFPGGAGLDGADGSSLRLEGRVQGANIVAQGAGPGFGPMVQWAVGSLPFFDDESFREVREFLAPYGTDIDDSGDWTPAGVTGALLPAWAEKLFNATSGGAVDERQWNATIGDVAKVLAVSGNYDPADPDDAERLKEDARKGARAVLLTRAALQGIAITGPSSTWRVNTDTKPKRPDGKWDPITDPDGHWFTLTQMQSAYYDLLEETGFDGEMATALFVERYGVEAWTVPYLAQGKSRSVGNLPVTAEGNYWVNDHEAASKKYRSTIGYFVPVEAEKGAFDFSVYEQQFNSGDRQSLTVDQQLALANRSRAYAIYNNAKKRLEKAAPELRNRTLDAVRASLEDEFPGWRDDVLGIESSMDTEGRIRELVRAASDPDLADAPVTPTLQTYLAARERILSVAESRGVGLSAKQNADLREALRNIGGLLVTKNDHFGSVWTRVLSREVED